MIAAALSHLIAITAPLAGVVNRVLVGVVVLGAALTFGAIALAKRQR